MSRACAHPIGLQKGPASRRDHLRLLPAAGEFVADGVVRNASALACSSCGSCDQVPREKLAPAEIRGPSLVIPWLESGGGRLRHATAVSAAGSGGESRCTTVFGGSETPAMLTVDSSPSYRLGNPNEPSHLLGLQSFSRRYSRTLRVLSSMGSILSDTHSQSCGFIFSRRVVP